MLGSLGIYWQPLPWTRDSGCNLHIYWSPTIKTILFFSISAHTAHDSTITYRGPSPWSMKERACQNLFLVLILKELWQFEMSQHFFGTPCTPWWAHCSRTWCPSWSPPWSPKLLWPNYLGPSDLSRPFKSQEKVCVGGWAVVKTKFIV